MKPEQSKASEKEALTPTASTSAMKRYQCEPAELIEALRARPCLWDRAHAQYRMRAAKERAWREVAAALLPRHHALTAAEKHELELIIMRKWYNIRDAYKKNRASSARPYVYAPLLGFLDSQLRPGPLRARHSIDEVIKDDEVEYYECEGDTEGEEWLNVQELEDVSPPPKKVARQLEYRRDEEDLVSALVGLVEKEEDEDRSFFRSITPAVKTLSDESKFLFRIEVMKILNRLRGKKPSVKVEAASEASDSD